MPKEYEELFGVLKQNSWVTLEVDQCASCGRHNGMQEVYNYVIKLEVFSYTIPVAKVCSGCEEVEFDGQEKILPRLADRCWRRQDRHTNRDSQDIQARWTKRQINRALRQIHCNTAPVPSKI